MSQVVKKICSLIHTLMTVCSYKTVVKFFPHQAADLEVAVGLLEQCEEEVRNTWRCLTVSSKVGPFEECD